MRSVVGSIKAYGAESGALPPAAVATVRSELEAMSDAATQELAHLQRYHCNIIAPSSNKGCMLTCMKATYQP
jgi:hypothetical protein